MKKNRKKQSKKSISKLELLCVAYSEKLGKNLADITTAGIVAFLLLFVYKVFPDVFAQLFGCFIASKTVINWFPKIFKWSFDNSTEFRPGKKVHSV